MGMRVPGGAADIRMSAEEVAVWRKRIQRSIRMKEQLGLNLRWSVLDAYYEGQYFSSLAKKHQIATNWMFSILRQTVAALYFQNPTFYMRGLTLKGRMAAPVVEQVYIAERQVMDAEEAERDFLQWGLQFGIGIMKHGYHSSLGAETPYREVSPEENDGGYADTQDEERIDAGAFSELWGRRHFGHAWKMAIPPQDFGFDADAKTVEDSRWFWHRYNRPYLDVKRDSRLDREARMKLGMSGTSPYFEEEDAGAGRERVKDDSGICRLYEVFDRQTNRVILLHDSCDRPLLNKRMDHFGDMGPYEFLVFFKSRHHPYGIPWCETFRSQVEVLNTIRSQMLEHLETWGQVRGSYRKHRISDESIKQLLKSRGNVLVPVETDEKLSDVIDLFERLEMSPDAWKLGDVYQRDLVDISGASELGSRTTETATEASYLEQKSNLRVGDMRYRFERSLVGSARRDMKTVRKYWGAERVVPIVGEDGMVWDMVRVSEDVVLSDYEVILEPGSTERVDKAVRTRQIIDAIGQLPPLREWLVTKGWDINIVELVKEYLKNTEVFRTVSKVLVPLQPMGMLPTSESRRGKQGPQGQPGAAGAVNGLGQMPQESGAGVAGRVLSEAFGGGAFGGSLS